MLITPAARTEKDADVYRVRLVEGRSRRRGSEVLIRALDMSDVKAALKDALPGTIIDTWAMA